MSAEFERIIEETADQLVAQVREMVFLPPRSTVLDVLRRQFGKAYKELEQYRGGPPAKDTLKLFQICVRQWVVLCLGEEVADDRRERNHRFLEEALELVQACGCSQAEAHRLVDYVYGRPVGHAFDEVGGTIITLAALCSANGIDLQSAAGSSLHRNFQRIEAIRAKHAAKPRNSPLPGPTSEKS